MKTYSIRKSYGQALAEYGEENHDVVVVVADVSSSVQTHFFAKRFSKRFFNVGITEQSLIDVSVGLSLGGKIPFANTFAVLFLRATEQIRTCVAYANTNVKMVGGYSGLSDFKDGPSHHSDTDIAIMRSLPNIIVMEPADATETRKMVPLIAEKVGPIYFRISRAELPILFDDNYSVEIGKGKILREGNDVTIIASGGMVSRSLEASEILKKEGIAVCVVNMHTIKPLDAPLIERLARQTGAVVTAEEHTVVGGLGGAVSEVVCENYPIPIERIGIPDIFTETALTYERLLDAYGMSVRDFVDATHRVLKRKR